MLILIYLFKKSIKPFFLPSAKFMFHHYLMGILMTVCGCMAVLAMAAFVVYYLYYPGNWVYLFIILFFVNLYSTIRAVQHLVALRNILKFCILTAEMGYRYHRLGISVIMESIKRHKIEESKIDNDLQPDMENPS